MRGCRLSMILISIGCDGLLDGVLLIATSDLIKALCALAVQAYLRRGEGHAETRDAP